MLKFSLPLILALLPASALAQPAANRADVIARMGEADLNRDGTVTRPELIEWRKVSFTRFDRNRDGAVSDADIPSFLRRSSVGGQFDLLKGQFDANRDGRVTREEFVGAPTAVFDMVDVNRDNVLTRAEIDAAAARARTVGGR
jgi:hypothetical protein